MDKTNNFILNNDGHIEKNIYATGWASSPSVGVIGTNKGKAIETVKKILTEVNHINKNSTSKLKDEIIKNNITYVSKNDWKTLNQTEEDRAMPNFVREKFKDINLVLKTLNIN